MKFDNLTSRSAPTTGLAELLGAFSYALDITQGQPPGHCVRSCFIGSRIGIELGLSAAERSDLYYTLLLKDLGCSSNAARICELYAADDLALKRDFTGVSPNLPAILGFVLTRTGKGRPLKDRISSVANILRNGRQIATDLTQARCTRGADIARTLRFSRAVCDSIYNLDEHWDGSGQPGRIAGEAIPLFSRIALLAQVTEVFHRTKGRAAAIAEAERRSASWFDPRIAKAFVRVALDESFWTTLESPWLDSLLIALAPPSESIVIDDAYLDSIAKAFGQVIDAKSPYTAGHSERVADLADGMARLMGIAPSRARMLRRAAALHDIGKLGVSNCILDKPAALDDAEWVEMRDHARHTGEILGRISAFSEMADIAAAHHERLDGAGYPRGLAGDAILLETRIITVSDFYDALTADRPYRAAMERTAALSVMESEIGRAIDGSCFEAIREVTKGCQQHSR